MPELPPNSEIVLALFVTFVGAMVQGSIGFGLAVVSSPILLLINHDWVPGSLMVAATVLTVLVALRERSAIAYNEVAVSSVSRLVATIPAAYFVGIVDRDTFEIVCALVILLVVTISLRGYELPFNRPNLVIASLLSGVTNTIAAVGGPPMALVYQAQRGPHLRATLSVIFAIGTTISMAALWAFGQFGLRDLVLGGLLLPSIFAGFFASRYLAPWVDARALRPAVLTLAGGSAVVILGRVLLAGAFNETLPQ